MTAPTTFISYSHDTQEHKLWVLELATRLRNNGVDALLDQWEVGPGDDLPHFMERSITASSRILMICTERYVEKANLGKGGVAYEKMIVTADLMAGIESKKVIPVVKQYGTQALPAFLKGKFFVDLSTSDQFESGFDQLLRELLGAPLFQKPDLGSAPSLKPLSLGPVPKQPDPISQFMIALASVYEKSSADGSIETVYVRRAMNVSKLLFDFAFDEAVKKGFIQSAGMSTGFWVLPAGRESMLRIVAGNNQG